MGQFLIVGILFICGVICVVCSFKVSLSDENQLVLFFIGSLICAIAFITVIACTSMKVNAKQEVVTYRYNYQMIKEIKSEGTEYENISISQTIIEYNNWLSKTKADKETWGIFSWYWFEDIDSLSYITK